MLAISLITVGDPATLTGGYLYHRRMAEAAPDHGARVDFVSFPPLPFPAAALGGPAVLRRTRALSPDVVVLDSLAAALAAPWASRLGPPLVAVLHQPPGGIDHRAVRTRVQAALDRRAYARAELLVAASGTLVEDLAGAGFPSRRVRLVPPGRDVAPLPSGPLPDLRAGRGCALLCVGNWVARKGILDLLAAVARLPQEAATLHLVGDDGADPRYAARVHRRVARPDLVDRVVVHGPLPADRLAVLYRAADLFVLPSRREPYGTVYAEAMAAGLPVVGWRAGNLPHLAHDGREGIVVPPGDVEALAAVLARLAGDAALRSRLGQAAERRARSFPTWAETASAFFSLLAEVAGGR